MSRSLFIRVAVCVMASVSAPADTPEHIAVSAIIAAAHEAYDRGDHEAARVHFEAWLEQSPGSPEAWYNAGNNAFRAGQAGEAVLYFRRAWYLNPRDADVRANMQLVQQRLGSIVPSQNLFDHAAQELSHREWTLVFKAGYWSSLTLAVAMLFIVSARRWLKPALIGALGLTLVAFTGWWYWKQWQSSGEAVLVTDRETARYEPRDSATAFFSVPGGSVVRIEESFDRWIKISAGGQSGWVPAASAQPVNAWKAPEID